MTQVILRSFLIASAFIFTGFSCDKDLGIKIYISDVEKGGIWRGQDKELIPYHQTQGYFCTDEQGMRKLIEAYQACEELSGAK